MNEQRRRTHPAKHIIYGVYARLMEDIRHYDLVQTQYRVMTSTLLMAAYVAIGFLFSPSTNLLPVSEKIVIISISLISLCITSIFCVLDLVFQERMSLANFIEAYRLEKSYKWLPQIHHRMVHNGRHDSGSAKKAIFYIGCGCSAILLSGFYISYGYGLQNYISLSISIITTFSLCIIYSISILKFTRNFKSLFNTFVSNNEDLC